MSSPSSSSLLSLAVRALLGLIMLIGFYVLSVVVVGGLLYLAYLLLRGSLRLAAAAFFSALTIAWSLIPRVEKFTAPGPRLLDEEQPQLFSELSRIARDANQKMPHEVFLIPTVNAWVAERGGAMGVGGQRVMGLGLPLLQTLTIGQLRAVLAHEYGHYYGGDTKLGPLVYRTYYAIVRTIRQLGNSVVNLPFIWYGRMYLLVTNSVSRHQEYTADAFAARLVGAQLLRDGLRATQRASLGNQAYWQNEVAPVLSAEYLPPIATGFEQFMASAGVATTLASVLQKQQSSEQTDAYDTHPALRERLAALDGLPAGEVPVPDLPAVSLLRDVRGLEKQMLTMALGDDFMRKLKPIEWQEVGNKIYVPIWHKNLREHAALLHGITADALERAMADRLRIGRQLRKQMDRPMSMEDATILTCDFISAALSVLLAQEGWQQAYTPGGATLFRRNAQTLNPFAIVHDLADGKVTYDAWREQCQAVGIAGIDMEKAIKAG